MNKARFIAEEFFRSVKKSFFKDLLLMIIFSIALVMTVLMSSYYLNLGERYEDSIQNYSEDGVWYRISMDDSTELSDSTVTAKGCQNVIDYCEKLRNIENHPMISVMTLQGLFMKEQAAQELFGTQKYERFLGENHPEGAFSAYVDNKTCSLMEFKSVQLDAAAYKFFGLETEAGEGFTEENTSLRKTSDSIPIVMGNEYKGIVSVGQTLELILESGAQIPEYGNIKQDMVSLDSCIIFPYGIQIPHSSTTKIEEIKKYADLDIWTLQNTEVQVADEGDFSELISTFRDIGQEFNFSPVKLYGASMGLNLLRKESAASVRIMLILTIVLVAFTFYGLFVTFYDKVQSNSRVYGIYLMNGCSLWMIVLPCLIEIAVILIPAVLVCQYLFTYDDAGGTNINVVLQTAYRFAGLTFLVGAIGLMFLMKGVDTEHLIRQKD
jgi:hypothetical protein